MVKISLCLILRPNENHWTVFCISFYYSLDNIVTIVLKFMAFMYKVAVLTYY